MEEWNKKQATSGGGQITIVIIHNKSVFGIISKNMYKKVANYNLRTDLPFCIDSTSLASFLKQYRQQTKFDLFKIIIGILNMSNFRKIMKIKVILINICEMMT